MGEYEEDADFDDLLGGDSDDDSDTEDSVGSRVGLLDINDITLNDGPSKEETREMYSLIDEMLPPDIDMDDQDDNEKKKIERLNQQKAEAAESRRKLQKMLHTVAPGINLFLSVKDDAEGEDHEEHNGFRYFSFDSLSLERDFEYKRRAKLIEHGFSDERVTDMLTDHREFVRHLMPEAQSVLLCDQSDFRSIMNFLFFSISVCTDPRLSELLTKALFDLRKNYGFKWSLSLKHVLACLINYGADESAVYSQRFYAKFLEKHLEAVGKSGQKVDQRYALPELPTFLRRRKKAVEEGQKDQQLQFVKMSPGNFRFCVEKFIVLVSDFSAGQPSHLEFRHKNNWSDQIVLLYILLLVGTDQRLIRNYRVREAVMLGVHFHLDSFTSGQWYWGPDMNHQPKTSEGHKDFNHSNVCKSLIILLNEFFPGENCPAVVNWSVLEEHADKVSFRKNNTSDHHLNMLARLDLIPPSFRGNQLKKYLSFMYLQTIAETVYVTPTHVDVFDLTDIPALCDELSPGLKLIVKAKNFEVMMTVVELYDIIIGHEPATDFTKDKVESIQRIQKNVLQWIQKKLPNMNRINIDDQRSIKGMQLSEFLDIVVSRWQTHSEWMR